MPLNITSQLAPAGLFRQLHTYLLDTSQDGCHLQVSSVGSGCHVANNSHLVTLDLVTAPIDDVHRDEVVRWCGLRP